MRTKRAFDWRSVIDLQPVLEQVRDPALEAVEPRERVVANREEEVCPQLGPVDRVRKLGVERAGPALVVVVEEVLLELIEQHE